VKEQGVFIMSAENIQDFEIQTLLIHGYLDIRGIAATKSSITVEEYFNLLSKFVKLAPSVSVALTKFTAYGSDQNDVDRLADISILMTGIGCNKLINEIDSIVAACNKNNKEFAANCAKKISDDFIRLYTLIMSARKSEKKENLSEIINLESLANNKLELNKSSTLKEALKYLDEHEANRKLRIFAVDDSLVILKIISSLLGDYEVYTLAKPTLVEKFLHQVTPDLFLLDYKMPELSGFDLIPIIRSFKEHKDTPIIFLTSEGTLDNLSAAVMLGAKDFVVKPVRPEILREKIAAHIVRKKLF
jgi:CheY-like chemotaxis protein